jgi:protein-tyrosine phosphatase
MHKHSSIDPITEVMDALYLGTHAYAISLQWDNPFNIATVVNLCEDPVPYSEGVRVEWLPVTDGEAIRADVIARALSAIDGALSSGRRVLVACRAGQSRSASLVIGYLRLRGYDWASAYRLVEEKRWICPHPRTLQSVRDFVETTLKVP